jgi:hypothetical protein
MSTHDISRHLFQPRKHYGGVRMQARRTITDGDWNEGELVRDEIGRRTRVDLVGESGSPDFGWRVVPGTLLALPDGTYDFALGAGTLYVGGQRLELFEDERLRFQGDWLQHRAGDRPDVPLAARQDVAFVLAWQDVVTPAEDAELYEASLGPFVDASVRVRQFARAMVWRDAPGDDCDQAWAAASAAFLASLCPGATLASDGEIVSPMHLTVAFTGDTETEDPCAPCVDAVGGGYLAAENQAIRVTLVGDGTEYTWGFDDAAPLYRVRLSGTTVEIVNGPARELLHPLRGQAVEILPWGALLDNGEKAADPIGFFTRVERSYDARDGTLELAAAPPAGTFVDAWTGHPHENELPGPDGLYFLMRVWRRGTDRSSDPTLAIPAVGVPAPLGNTGLTVAFSAGQGCPGDHWVIAARRNEPTRVVPWALQDLAGAPPHGPRRFLAPLARIRWSVPGFDIVDCRPRFRALAHRTHCCTFTVGAGAAKCAGHFETIQAAIDALPIQGGTICVLPGDYPEHVHIDARVNVTIRGCGPRTRIVDPLGPQRLATATDPPLVRICNSQRITLESLAVAADGVVGVRVVNATESGGGRPSDIELRDVTIVAREAGVVGTLQVVQAKSAVELLDATDVRIEGCELEMVAPLSVFPAVFLLGERVAVRHCRVRTTGAGEGAQPWGGVQIPGGAVDVTIEDCEITGGLGYGITLGSVGYAPIDAQRLPVLAQVSAVPVGVASIATENGVGEVSLFALGRTENGQPLAPVPGPIAWRIRIARNHIHGAGTGGIGPAAYWAGSFGDPTRASAITLARLAIEDNDISGNALVPPLAVDQVAPPRIPGVGGIGLPAVADARIVGNRITDNGTSHVEPIVGVYVLEGGVIEVADNVVVQNGPRVGDPPIVRRGRRGGVVIMRAVGHAGDFIAAGVGLADHLPPVPRPALVVRGNSIAQPEGKALYVPDLRGDALVEGNALSSCGDRLPYVDTLDLVQLEVAIRPSELVLDRRACTGLGAVVYLRNDVRAIDAFATSAGAPLGAHVGFQANQVSLDWRDVDTAGPQLCAVLIDALFDAPGNDGGTSGAGDVAIVGNQFQAVMHQTADGELLEDRARNVLLAHVVALGRTVRLVENRIAEGRTDALVSAFVWGVELPPWASLNVATHCIVGSHPLEPSVQDNEVLEPAGSSCSFTVVPIAGARGWVLQEDPVPPP